MPNRLYHVNDAVATGLASNEDVSDPGYIFTNNNLTVNIANNFSYDEIGNLKRNSSEGIKHIEWTIIGKVKNITRYDGFSKTVNQTTIYPSDLEFLYDAMGNRIAKVEKTRDENGLKSSANRITTYYTRDAQGNIMSVYKISSEAQQTSFAQTEVSIYGSSRVGVDNTLTELISPVPQGNVFSNILGKKQYELTNHLGNVLATVSDIKIQQDYNSDNEVDIYKADIITTQYYYPGGFLMPGRTFNPTAYKFGYGGHEKIDEVYGSANVVDLGDRWLDVRLARTHKLDSKGHLYPGISPYSYAANNPLIFIDPDGEKVRTMNEDAFNVILSSLSPEVRGIIKMNRKGFIKASSVRAALKISNSGNLKALQTLVKDKRTTEVYTTEKSYEYIHPKSGSTETIQFQEPTRENMFQKMLDEFKGTPEEKEKYAEQLKSLGIEDKIEVSGNFGSALRPANEQKPFPGGQIAPGENFRVYVNPVGTTGEEKAGNIGHELFGHIYFYIIGKDPRHGGANGNLTGNPELENYIKTRKTESIENYKKKP